MAMVHYGMPLSGRGGARATLSRRETIPPPRSAAEDCARSPSALARQAGRLERRTAAASLPQPADRGDVRLVRVARPAAVLGLPSRQLRSAVPPTQPAVGQPVLAARAERRLPAHPAA